MKIISTRKSKKIYKVFKKGAGNNFFQKVFPALLKKDYTQYIFSIKLYKLYLEVNMEKCNCNSGVCCNVCVCKYNVDGCKCKLDEIKVTKGDGNSKQYCGSYCPNGDC